MAERHDTAGHRLVHESDGHSSFVELADVVTESRLDNRCRALIVSRAGTRHIALSNLRSKECRKVRHFLYLARVLC